jgi:hypothetical protein
MPARSLAKVILHVCYLLSGDSSNYGSKILGKIVSVLNMYRQLFLVLLPKQYYITTIYIVLGSISNVEVM